MCRRRRHDVRTEGTLSVKTCGFATSPKGGGKGAVLSHPRPVRLCFGVILSEGRKARGVERICRNIAQGDADGTQSNGSAAAERHGTAESVPPSAALPHPPPSSEGGKKTDRFKICPFFVYASTFSK